MIQRIQSVFLFFVGVCMVVMLFTTIWTKQNSATNEVAQLSVFSLSYQKQTQVINQTPTFYIGILCVAAMIISYISLFSYKNRMLQIKMNWANSLLMIVILLLCTYFSISKGEAFFGAGMRGSYGIGMFMPPVALLLNSLANRFIWKDEKLVKSIDRLR